MSAKVQRLVTTTVIGALGTAAALVGIAKIVNELARPVSPFKR